MAKKFGEHKTYNVNQIVQFRYGDDEFEGIVTRAYKDNGFYWVQTPYIDEPFAVLAENMRPTDEEQKPVAPIPLYDEIKAILVRRGWKIDESAVESKSGILREFIHPEDGFRYAYIDAILEERVREARDEE